MPREPMIQVRAKPLPPNAGTQLSVVLPLFYIRPFGSKCFAGGLLQFRGSGSEAKDLQDPPSPSA
jgi:hypothetical protein